MDSIRGVNGQATLACLIAVAALGISQRADAAADGLARKSGLWEIRTTIEGRPATSPVLQCIDEKTDDVMGRGGITGAKCSRNEVKRQGNRITVSAACEVGGTRTTTEGVFTGDFTRAYQADLQTTYDPPTMGMQQARMKIDAKWTGPCKAGQKPGQIVMPQAAGR